MSKLIRSKRALDEAVIALFDHAPYLYPLYALTGPLPLRHHKPGFAGLARLIVSQQVSTASARAIWGRVLAAFPALDPDAILAATDTDLRACGLSAPKIRTLRAIATAVATGTLPLARLGRMPADKAHALMVAVKGIGFASAMRILSRVAISLCRRDCAWPMNLRNAPMRLSLKPMPRTGAPIAVLSHNCSGPITGS
jgi:3-methyladenine DNA glycosylase/8-oxoguanine DNA glycosylase